MYGEGGSIPFVNLLAKMYPETNIVALGVGGPESNAHVQDEFLEIAYTKKLTCCLSYLIESCAKWQK